MRRLRLFQGWKNSRPLVADAVTHSGSKKGEYVS